MESYMEVTYEVIDPVSRESFITTDRYVAEHHYEESWLVNETHTTITVSTPFSQTRVHVISSWKDEDFEPDNKER